MDPSNKKKPNWFLYERFSYLDLIVISIIGAILKVVSHHLAWS